MSWTAAIKVPNPFTAANANKISWAAPTGVSGLNYDVQINDSMNAVVYSTLPAAATNITVPGNTLVANSSYSATVQAISVGTPIANAATGSNFSFVGSATSSIFKPQ